MSEIVKIDLQVISGVIQLIVGEVCARMPISHFLKSVLVLKDWEEKRWPRWPSSWHEAPHCACHHF